MEEDVGELTPEEVLWVKEQYANGLFWSKAGAFAARAAKVAAGFLGFYLAIKALGGDMLAGLKSALGLGDVSK